MPIAGEAWLNRSMARAVAAGGTPMAGGVIVPLYLTPDISADGDNDAACVAIIGRLDFGDISRYSAITGAAGSISAHRHFDYNQARYRRARWHDARMRVVHRPADCQV